MPRPRSENAKFEMAFGQIVGLGHVLYRCAHSRRKFDVFSGCCQAVGQNMCCLRSLTHKPPGQQEEEA